MSYRHSPHADAWSSVVQQSPVEAENVCLMLKAAGGSRVEGSGAVAAAAVGAAGAVAAVDTLPDSQSRCCCWRVHPHSGAGAVVPSQMAVNKVLRLV